MSTEFDDITSIDFLDFADSELDYFWRSSTSVNWNSKLLVSKGFTAASYFLLVVFCCFLEPSFLFLLGLITFPLEFYPGPKFSCTFVKVSDLFPSVSKTNGLYSPWSVSFYTIIWAEEFRFFLSVPLSFSLVKGNWFVINNWWVEIGTSC